MLSNLCFWLFAKRLKWVFLIQDGSRAAYKLAGFFTRAEVIHWHEKIVESANPEWVLIRSPLEQLQIHGAGI